MITKMSTRDCRKRISVVWFSLGGFLALLVILQSLLGRFGEGVNQAWAWFLPTVMPTLSLITSVLVVDMGSGGGHAAKRVDRYLYLLALWLSVAYLLIVALTFLIQPLVGTPILQLMQMSNLWLGPLQGLVAAALGAFFLKGEEKPEMLQAARNQT